MGITDHQMSLEVHGKIAIMNGIRRRRIIIEHINSSNNNLRVLNGIELLIKADGELSYPNEILGEFDFVIGAIHTGFNQSQREITARYLKALENPFVKIIAHPTGRILGQRAEMEVDWAAVFKACLKYNKYLEIDALPERLDLPDLLVREGKKVGVKFCIDTDAHDVAHLNLMPYGVSMARRGWLTRQDVINTLPFAKLKEALRIKGLA